MFLKYLFKRLKSGYLSIFKLKSSSMVAMNNFIISFENECCSLGTDPEIMALIFNWKGILPSPAFREIHHKALQLIRNNKFSKILGDTTHMKTMGSEDIAWINSFWMPSAIEAGLRQCAIIESNNAFNRMTVNAVVEKVKPEEATFNFFNTFEAARFWLKNS
jgi:hypothetical protein